MAKVTIYLPDDLAERVRAAGVSMSPVCQAALEKEVTRMTSLAAVQQQMNRIEVEVGDKRGERIHRQAFIGTWLVPPGDDNRSDNPTHDAGAAYGVALTQKQKIAVYSWHVNGRWGPFLAVYDSLAEAEEDGIPSNILAEAADSLGEDFVIELDI